VTKVTSPPEAHNFAREIERREKVPATDRKCDLIGLTCGEGGSTSIFCASVDESFNARRLGLFRSRCRLPLPPLLALWWRSKKVFL